MKNFGRNILFWLIAGSVLFMVLENYSNSTLKEELTYSEFKQEVKGKKVKSIVYKGDQMTVEVERFNGTKYTTQKPAYISDSDLNESLTEADVEIAFEALEKPSVWSQLLIGAFPLLLLLGIFFIFMRNMLSCRASCRQGTHGNRCTRWPRSRKTCDREPSSPGTSGPEPRRRNGSLPGQPGHGHGNDLLPDRNTHPSPARACAGNPRLDRTDSR